MSDIDESVDCTAALIHNRAEIIKTLENPNEVVDVLLEMDVFDFDMARAIYQEPEKEQKTKKMMNTLTYKAVCGLHHAFLNTSNEYLAELLTPYIKKVEEKENLINPSMWPPTMEEQVKMEKDHVIKITDVKHHSFIHEYTSREVYQMRNRVHGKVYIINNMNFSPKVRLGRRTGSDIDAKNLQNLFTDLQFDVITGNNLTASGMVQFLQQERDKVNWHGMECVILVIMSHGEITGVYGQDGNITPLQKLTEIFDSNNCPGLNGKPRLVFVQADRTRSHDGSYGVSSIETDTTGNVVQSTADFLIAYCTPEGCMAYRNIQVGSWFLNAVVWVFKYHAHQTDIQHLMTKVNELVSKSRTNRGDSTISECTSRLRKKLYFFPGVYGNPPKTIDGNTNLPLPGEYGNPPETIDSNTNFPLPGVYGYAKIIRDCNQAD